MTVSWLMLERYELGELDPADRSRVEMELSVDPETRRRLATLREDVRAPPPLVLGPDSGLPLPEPSRRRREPWWGVAAGVALAAAAAVLVLRVGLPTGGGGPGTRGGELVLTLEAERLGALADGAAVPVGTVFQAHVTWPDTTATVQLVADGDALWEGTLAEGNRWRVPGAWAVGDGPVDICVVVEEHRVCKTVVGVPR